MIHAASREALATLKPRVEAVVNRFSAEEGFTTLAGELYDVVDLLTGQPRLRRMLADPATRAEGRAALVASLLSDKVGTSTVQVVQDAVSLRWSSPWDMLDAIEAAGDEALIAAAERQRVMERVEDELFRFERILDAEPNLAALLDDASTPGARRRTLLDRVVEEKVHPLTKALLDHAVASQRKRSLVLAIDDLTQAAAARRDRSVARVASATDLTAQQQRDLAAALSAMYGRQIEVRYAVDTSIRGGLVVRIGDELIDGSVATRLTEIRAAFAG